MSTIYRSGVPAKRGLGFATGAVLTGVIMIFLLPFLYAWVIMLLLDPATHGQFTIGYGQALAISVLLSFVGSAFNVTGNSKND